MQQTEAGAMKEIEPRGGGVWGWGLGGAPVEAANAFLPGHGGEAVGGVAVEGAAGGPVACVLHLQPRLGHPQWVCHCQGRGTCKQQVGL